VVHALAETIKALQEHIFNWTIWPDFTELPNKSDAVLKFEVMRPGAVCELSGRQIEMISVNHTVPCVGYCVESAGKVFAYSGDTTSNENLWSCLNKHDSVELLFIETAFADREVNLAKLAFHYCPQLLAEDLSKLKHKTKVCISHLKPGCEREIIAQCNKALPDWDIHQLKSGDVFQL
jgi:cAMP phosphodiesterase